MSANGAAVGAEQCRRAWAGFEGSFARTVSDWDDPLRKLFEDAFRKGLEVPIDRLRLAMEALAFELNEARRELAHLRQSSILNQPIG